MYISFLQIVTLAVALIPSFVDATKGDKALWSFRTPDTAARNQIQIKLYWLEQSRSQRILWLLEELKLPYDVEIFRRDKITKLAGPELKDIHALGKFPVVTIQTRTSSKPIVLAESGFIIEYLIENFSNYNYNLLPTRFKNGQNGLIGDETEEWMRHKYFMQYAEGSLMPLLTVGVIARQIRQYPVPFFVKPVVKKISNMIYSTYLGPNLRTHFNFLEHQLRTNPDGGEYLCGTRLTGADILMSFPLIAAKKVPSFGLTEEKYPHLSAYVTKLEQHEGYQRSVSKIISIEGSFQAIF